MPVKTKTKARPRKAVGKKPSISVAGGPLIDRARLLSRLRQEYDPVTAARALQVNEDFPVYGEP